MSHRTANHRRPERSRSAHRPPLARIGRPALYLSAAATGALVVGVLVGGEPAAPAGRDVESVSIAEQLGVSEGGGAAAPPLDAGTVAPLEQLAASRAERDAARTAAADAQAAADQAERNRLAAEEAARLEAERLEAERLEAERQAAERAEAERAAAEEAELAAAERAAAERAAAEEAERAAAERAAAERAAAERAVAAPAAPAPAPPARPAPPAPAAAAPAGSFQQYAMGKLGGSGEQFSCLERLWGKESGWNPAAQNPRSSAYGIAQFLDSTWAGTGIAKTSDGYRQIDAGLIYIEERYGSPCGAWSHSQRVGWY